MNHFINLKDVPAKDLQKIVADAKKRKNLRKKLSTLEVDKGAPLKGKLLIQMFEKSSLRTRLSFYLAIKQLGGGTLTLRSNELHLGQGGESIADTAKILSTYGDGFMLRTDSDEKVENFRDHLTIPVINGLSPSSHPTQVLSDVFTVEEIKKKKISKLNRLTEAQPYSRRRDPNPRCRGGVRPPSTFSRVAEVACDPFDAANITVIKVQDAITVQKCCFGIT